MNISSLSVSMPLGSTGSTAIDLALMSKVLDTAQESGDALVQMMEAAATGLGQNIDVMA